MITSADFLKWLVFYGYPPGGGGGGGGTVTPAQVQHNSFNFASGLGADDAFAVDLSPAVSGLSDGMTVIMSTAFTNLTDTPTLNVNGLGALPIVSGNGSPLIPGDIIAGTDYIFVYSATDNNFQLINPTVSSANAYLVQKNYFNYAPDIGAANAYVANLPVKPLVVLANGNPVTLEIANTNTGASTLTLNGVIAPIVNESGGALVAGQLTANGLFNFVYSGVYSAWVLMNPKTPVLPPESVFSSGSVIYSNGTILTEDNTNLNWNDSNYTLHISQPSSLLTLEPVCVITSDPSGSHGHGNMLNIDGNPGGGGTICRTDGGGNRSWLQLYGGDYSGTNGGGVYINGNNSTDGDAGGVQTTFGLSSSSFQMYDYTQSILLFQLNNSGVLQLPLLTANSALATDASSNVTASSTTATELGYVHGVTSAIQTQLNAKQPLNANLTAISGLTPTNNSYIKGNGTDFVSTTLVPLNQVYVDFNNGNDTTGNGSQFAPWLTLQHAYNSITPAFANPFTIYISGHEDLSDVGTITAKANVNLVGIGNAPLITNAITIGTNLANDIVYFQNLILNGAVTWIRNDGFAPELAFINVQCSQLVDFEQNGGGVADSLFYAYNSTLTGLTTQIGQVSLQSTNLYGNVDFKDAGSAAYFLTYSGDFFQSAITLNGGVYAEFAGIFSDASYTLTGVTTGSGTPSINTDSNSIPLTLSGAYTLGLISQAKYINSNYTPVNYTATSSDVTGNLQGIDNALGTLVSGELVWSVKTSGTGLLKSNGYYANSASTITFPLPATAAIGDTFALSNMNTGNFVISQGAGQSIEFGNVTTTVGVGGSITSTNMGDSLFIVCKVANTGFQVVPGAQGQLFVI